MINKTFEELGEYRSPDGYIDFDRVVEESEVETKREYRGNVNREKDWIEIEGGSVLVKTDADGQPNSEYSELISCALARQAGIETAQYDMVRYKGETGLITKNMCKPGEEMISIYELIGNGPDSEICPDTIDIYHVFDNLDEKLQAEGFDDNEIDSVMLSLRKQLLFDLTIMEADRHLENLSLIFGKDENGKRTARLAPMYDTEAALVLGNEPDKMNIIAGSWAKTAALTAMQEPRISIIPEPEEEAPSIPSDMSPELANFFAILRGGVKQNAKEEFGSLSEEMWKKTLDFLCEDERVAEYFETTISKLDISKALAEVEGKIGTRLPEHVRAMATACFEDRKMAMEHRHETMRDEFIQGRKRSDDDIII